MDTEKLQLIKITNPFDRNNRTYQRIDYKGQTLLSIREEYFPKEDIVVSVNGGIISQDQWSIYHVKNNDCILFIPEIRGGQGGGNKDILRIVLMIIVVVASIYTGGAVGAASTAFWGSIAAMAVNVVGMLLINFLLPPVKPKLPGMDNFGSDISQTYSWSPQTTQAPGIVIPRVYGTHRVYGNIIDAFVTNTEEPITSSQWLNMLICLGFGPIKGLRNFTLNDQPTKNFGVYPEVRMGKLSQPPVSFFQSTKTEYAMSVKVDDTNPFTYTTPEDDFDSLEVEVAWPNGLYHVNDAGGLDAISFTYSIEIQKVGTGTWSPLTSETVTTVTHTPAGRWSLGKPEPDADGNGIWREYYAGPTNRIANDPDDGHQIYEGKSGNFVDGGGNQIYGLTWTWVDTGDVVSNTTTSLTTSTMTVGKAQNIRKTWLCDLAQTGGHGQYNIRITAITADSTDSRTVNGFYLATVREVYTDTFTYPRNVLVGLHAMATNQLSGSMRFSCIEDGLLVAVYTDPNTYTVQWSNNPAWVNMDVLTQPVWNDNLTLNRYDKKLPSELEIQDWIDWATFCDELVDSGKVAYNIGTVTTTNGSPVVTANSGSTLFTTNLTRGDSFRIIADSTAYYQIKSIDAEDQITLTTNYAGSSGSGKVFTAREKEARYTFNGVFDTEQNMGDAAWSVAQVGRAALVPKGNKLSVVVDKIRTPGQLFSTGNITSPSFKKSFVSLDDRANEIEINFTNSEKNYERDSITIINSSINTGSNKISLQFPGITKASEAWRQANYRLLCNQYLKRVVEFDLDVDALAETVGDVIRVAYDEPMKGGRVVSSTNGSVTLDREVTIAASPKTYQIVIRRSNTDLVETKTVTNVGPETTNVLTISGTWTSNPVLHDVYSFGETNYAYKLFIVSTIKRKTDKTISIGAGEYREECYVDGTPDIPAYDYTVFNPCVEIEDLILVERYPVNEDDNTRRSIDVSWRLATTSIAKYCQVWYRNITVATPIWIHVGDTTTTNFSIYNIDYAQTYEVKVVGVNSLGIVCPYGETATIITSGEPDWLLYGPLQYITGLRCRPYSDSGFVSYEWDDYNYIVPSPTKDITWYWNEISFPGDTLANEEPDGAGTEGEDSWLQDYQVQIFDSWDPTVLRELYVDIPEYTYTEDMNKEDHGGTAVDEIVIQVRSRDTYSQLSRFPATKLAEIGAI